MEPQGLPMGALLVVDRSKRPRMNSIVIIRHEGQFLCRLMARLNGRIVFTNGTEPPDDIIPTTDDTEIIGVVTASIKLYDLSY